MTKEAKRSKGGASSTKSNKACTDPSYFHFPARDRDTQLNISTRSKLKKTGSVDTAIERDLAMR